MRGAAFSIMSDMQEYLHVPAKGGSKPICEHFPNLNVFLQDNDIAMTWISEA